jgi:hypothetical protein
MALRLLPAALALLVLGAHFLRAGHLALVAATLAVVALLFVRRRGPRGPFRALSSSGPSSGSARSRSSPKSAARPARRISE